MHAVGRRPWFGAALLTFSGFLGSGRPAEVGDTADMGEAESNAEVPAELAVVIKPW